ncbi:hypothetical protein Q7C36_012985 [Tachysurus vachellii]|uniref:Uncharacterized protein n=1 Tax=Tachysurus vachellii TaxID=175792 RepID=A0AA88MR50_TACVA|nr:hypothetical protein Q7C36_012985 [Tachysurus vachellii]
MLISSAVAVTPGGAEARCPSPALYHKLVAKPQKMLHVPSKGSAVRGVESRDTAVGKPLNPRASGFRLGLGRLRTSTPVFDAVSNSSLV